MEDGPQAQLYIHAGEIEFEISGSHGTSFGENDDISVSWTIPNVLGVRPQLSATK